MKKEKNDVQQTGEMLKQIITQLEPKNLLNVL